MCDSPTYSAQHAPSLTYKFNYLSRTTTMLLSYPSSLFLISKYSSTHFTNQMFRREMREIAETVNDKVIQQLGQQTPIGHGNERGERVIKGILHRIQMTNVDQIICVRGRKAANYFLLQCHFITILYYWANTKLTREKLSIVSQLPEYSAFVALLTSLSWQKMCG